MPILTLFLSILLIGSADASFTDRSCFVQSGAHGNGSSLKSPYGSLKEVEADARCRDIYVLKGDSALDGGVVLRDGQRLVGLGNQPTLSNTLNREQGVTPVVTLANHTQVKNLRILSLGVGIFGDNITDAVVEQVQIVKPAFYAKRRSPLSLLPQHVCKVVRDAKGEVDSTRSILRGCDYFSFAQQIDGVPTQYSAIVFLADDRAARKQIEVSLKDVHIQDFEPNALAARSFWGSGVLVQSAGSQDVKVHVKLSRLVVKGPYRGYEFHAYQSSTLKVDADRIVADDLWGDAFSGVTGFYCAGRHTSPVVCKTTQVPRSEDPQLILSIDHSAFLHSQGEAQPFLDGQGVELTASEDGKGRHEIHIQNTTITGQTMGFFLFGLWGYPRVGLYDLGCINPECAEKGFTSTGGNRIFRNNAGNQNVEAKLFESREVFLYGVGDVMAQNNYWGGPGLWGITNGSLTEIVDGQRRCQREYTKEGKLIRDTTPPLRCQINDLGDITTGAGSINDDFSLALDPEKNQDHPSIH